ncbi:MAG: DUF4147 domain-containing protein [Oscillospiraceae bacterium]|nr:DUF4147 domain-containing protein [Oscillospiraceae bacterium]
MTAAYKTLYSHADAIIRRSIEAVLPDAAVKTALRGRAFPGRVFLVAAGKAAWRMAAAAADTLGRLDGGAVITKYGHVMGPLPGLRCFEAGHPVPDENSFAATRAALSLTEGLRGDDTVLFLLSGGGSALFESPLIPGDTLRDVTDQLLACGADIVEINTIRKRLSAVKGGRFALHCAPAHVFTIILSDIVGDPVDMIASGPACPDSSTAAQALAVADKYALRLDAETRALLAAETPKTLDNVETAVTGSVRALCRAAAEAARSLGYAPEILTESLQCEARDAGARLGALARERAGDGKAIALIAGGETVVRLTGHGLGGRNQELALAAAEEIAGLENVLVFSLGSDGTDGPTDAAGGIVTGETAARLAAKGISIPEVLRQNDSYRALQAADGLIVTGPTGTNVNDIAVALIAG